MSIHETIEILKLRKTDFLKTKSFSQLPGIYTFFFIGDDFPILGNKVSKNQIIYIGKTESSQEKRDAKTHFTSGKTGSSTVRKSIGSLLCSTMKLTPVPRNSIDYGKNRFSHFKFDEESEMKITEWMANNLALSFYEYPKTKKEIEHLESELIDAIVPVLNISKNSKNFFRNSLLQYRKNCALSAAKIEREITHKIISNTTMNKPLNIDFTRAAGKYIDLWARKTKNIEKALSDFSIKSLQLNPEEFKQVGNRKSYSFNLEYVNGAIHNDISGSAVARDLDKAIQNSIEIKKLLKIGHFKINMDKQFCLWIKRMS